MTIQTKVLQLATSREAKASGTPGPNDVFYQSIDYNHPIPPNLVAVTLSSNSDGTGDTYVDDQVKISINDTEILSHDYSHGNSGRIIPMGPQSLLSQFNDFSGQSVKIDTKFIDLYRNSNGASNFYLVIQYNA